MTKKHVKREEEEDEKIRRKVCNVPDSKQHQEYPDLQTKSMYQGLRNLDIPKLN